MYFYFCISIVVTATKEQTKNNKLDSPAIIDNMRNLRHNNSKTATTKKKPLSQSHKRNNNNKKKKGDKELSDVYQYEGADDSVKHMRRRMHIDQDGGDMSDDSKDDRVQPDDDESIGSDDVGWNSEDEVAFGSMVTKNKQVAGQQYNSSDEYSYDDEYDEEDDIADGGTLLSDLIQSSSVASHGTNATKHNARDGDDADDDNDEEDDDDGDVNHDGLLSAIDRFSNTGKSSAPARSRRDKIMSQGVAESEFSTLTSADTQVSLDALLAALEDNTTATKTRKKNLSQPGLDLMKSRLTELHKTPDAPKQVNKVEQSRVERSLTYEKSNNEVSTKWQDIVATNKHVKSLDLAQDRRGDQMPSYKKLVQRFAPTTSMEQEVQMVLIGNGQTDAQALQNENDDLEGAQLSVEELKDRQTELAKVKALLFYEQVFF